MCKKKEKNTPTRARASSASDRIRPVPRSPRIFRPVVGPLASLKVSCSRRARRVFFYSPPCARAADAQLTPLKARAPPVVRRERARLALVPTPPLTARVLPARAHNSADARPRNARRRILTPVLTLSTARQPIIAIPSRAARPDHPRNGGARAREAPPRPPPWKKVSQTPDTRTGRQTLPRGPENHRSRSKSVLAAQRAIEPIALRHGADAGARQANWLLPPALSRPSNQPLLAPPRPRGVRPIPPVEGVPTPSHSSLPLSMFPQAPF